MALPPGEGGPCAPSIEGVPYAAPLTTPLPTGTVVTDGSPDAILASVDDRASVGVHADVNTVGAPPLDSLSVRDVPWADNAVMLHVPEVLVEM